MWYGDLVITYPKPYTLSISIYVRGLYPETVEVYRACFPQSDVESYNRPPHRHRLRLKRPKGEIPCLLGASGLVASGHQGFFMHTIAIVCEGL